MLWLFSIALGGGLAARLAELEGFRAQRIAKGAPKLSAAQVAQIEAGGQVLALIDVAGSESKKAFGARILPVSVGVLWAAINDETQHPGYTGTSYSELVSGTRCGAVRQVFQYVELPLVDDRWWVATLRKNTKLQESSAGAVRELAWNSVIDESLLTPTAKAKAENGAPIAFSNGGWYLVDLGDGRTLAEYFTHADPGGSVPTSAANAFATDGVEQNLDAMERFARDGKSRCKVE